MLICAIFKNWFRLNLSERTVDMVEGEGGTSWEISIDTYTLLCVRDS